MSMATAERPSILIVDDAPTNIETLVAMLEDEYELSIATSGAQALDLIPRGLAPDLVLLDVMMPGMDGYEVCARLKSSPATSDIPVIFVTARADGESESRALAGGAVDFIHKPVNKAVVRARVRMHLELTRCRHRLEDSVHARTLELARARDQAESASRAKTAFLASVGHELRTPMNHIMGFTHLLAGEVHGEQGRELLKQTEQASERLLRLINGTLDFARTEAGEIAIESIDFDLARLLDRVEDECRTIASTKGIVIVREIDPGLPLRLRGDPIRLGQVLQSLLENAIKFSDRGPVSFCVRQTGARAGAVSLRIEVRDLGIGMSPEVQAGLFEPFLQGDGADSRRYEGLGLGLALSKRLVDLMAGEIGVSSAPGMGSTFWVSLRLAPGDAPVSLASPSAPVDWLRVREAVTYMTALLADGDCQSRILWGDLSELFEPVLKRSTGDVQAALDNFDFDTALQLLQEAVSACPGLSSKGS